MQRTLAISLMASLLLGAAQMAQLRAAEAEKPKPAAAVKLPDKAVKSIRVRFVGGENKKADKLEVTLTKPERIGPLIKLLRAGQPNQDHKCANVGYLDIHFKDGSKATLGLSDTLSGLPLAVLGIGIAVGSVMAGRLSAGKVEYGLIPAGAVGMTLVTLALGLFGPGVVGTNILMMLLGESDQGRQVGGFQRSIRRPDQRMLFERVLVFHVVCEEVHLQVCTQSSLELQRVQCRTGAARHIVLKTAPAERRPIADG